MLFAKKTDAETSTLNDVKNAILTALGNETPGTAEYEKLLTELERIEALIVKNPPWSFKPSADVILNSAVSLLSIGLIIRHENFNVITSKAVAFIPKLFR